MWGRWLESQARVRLVPGSSPEIRSSVWGYMKLGGTTSTSVGTTKTTAFTRVTPFRPMHLHNYERSQSIRFLEKAEPPAENWKPTTKYRKQRTPFFYAQLRNGTLHMSMPMFVSVSVSMSWALDATCKSWKRVGALGHNAAELQSQSQSVTPIRKAASETKGSASACGLETAAWGVKLNKC